jgi:hypothetical protein
MFVGWYRYHQSREEKTTNLLPIIKGNQMKAQPIAGPIPNLTVRPNKHAEPMERPRAAVAAGFRIPPSTTRHPRASGGPLGRERERETEARRDERGWGKGNPPRFPRRQATRDSSVSIHPLLPDLPRARRRIHPHPHQAPPAEARRRPPLLLDPHRSPASKQVPPPPPPRFPLSNSAPPDLLLLPPFLPPTHSDRIGGGCCCCCGLLRLLCNCNSTRIGCAAVASVSRLGSIAWSHPFQPVPGNSPPLLFVWLWPIVKRRLAIPPPFVWPIYTKHDAQLLNLLPVSDRCWLPSRVEISSSHVVRVEISSSRVVKVEIHLALTPLI